MDLPKFEEFKKQINLDSAAYDFNTLISAAMTSGTVPFTPEQIYALAACSVSAALALLQQYHTWLSETLQSSQPEE